MKVREELRERGTERNRDGAERGQRERERERMRGQREKERGQSEREVEGESSSDIGRERGQKRERECVRGQ